MPQPQESNSVSCSTPNSKNHTDELRGYLHKKTKHGKWQKRWFETNGCFLTYYKREGQKLLAALNLPQVGSITLVEDDGGEDGDGLFNIEINERLYTIRAQSKEEAAKWVEGLVWRKNGGVVSPDGPVPPSSVEWADVHQIQSEIISPTTAIERCDNEETLETNEQTAKSKGGKNSGDEVNGCANMDACCVIL